MTFSKEFFVALNNWQKGWNEDQSRKASCEQELKIQCEALDSQFKSVREKCYRKRFLVKGELRDIFYNNAKPEGLTSWTTDIRYAEFFKGKFRTDAVTAAIFEHTPTKSEVILNISELWKSPYFLTSLDTIGKVEPKVCDAIRHFKDFQKEVILEVPLKGSEIYALTGISSSFDDICTKASIPENERPATFKRLIDAGAYIEELTYVRGDAARNAINNAIWKFHEMLEEKKEK
jgi:hypothetical protein